MMDLQRDMSTCMHESSKSSVTNLTTGATSANDGDENPVPIIDWSSLVIEPTNEGDENAGEEKGIPDEKPVDEHAMFALFGFKTEENVRADDVKPNIPIPNYGLHDCEGADMFVDDKAPNEPLIVWDERHPHMDVGTPYPNMVEFRKAIKQFAINGEFEYGTKKNEPERFRAFCKGKSQKDEPCKWAITANWQRDAKCVMVVKHQTQHICSSTSGKVTNMTCQSWVADKAKAILKKDAGRTRKQRIKAWWEGGTRKGALNKCKRCGELGHRESGCPNNGTKKRNGKGKKNMSPWFDVSVSNLVPSTPTKNQAAATTSSPGPTTRSQAAAATTSSPGPVTRSQSAASTPLKSPPAKGKKMTPKKRKSSDL